MDFLQIALIVLVVVGVWAVVEVALTMRTARREVEKITTSANEVIEQAQPIVAKLDGIVDELEPAAKRMAPLAERTERTVEAANVSVERLNGILEDVSSVSGTASSVTGAVNRVAESAASGVASVVSRLRGTAAHEGAARLDGPSEAPAEGDDGSVLVSGPVQEEPAARVRYVDYAEVAAQPAAAEGTTDGSDASETVADAE